MGIIQWNTLPWCRIPYESVQPSEIREHHRYRIPIKVLRCYRVLWSFPCPQRGICPNTSSEPQLYNYKIYVKSFIIEHETNINVFRGTRTKDWNIIGIFLLASRRTLVKIPSVHSRVVGSRLPYRASFPVETCSNIITNSCIKTSCLPEWKDHPIVPPHFALDVYKNWYSSQVMLVGCTE